ncbi:phosphoadenylyl-sulfate reductase [Sandaracinobacteroides saxicola]|uniref:Adenosine 5'-phosphosulfate reductase n=1 Tax=Sandaracinobacteroides saxicola TaxID=2759707 RepID=A0A7G5IHH7_9SPHN|nr:phosphoadenylyl-sulfate reductase [Sandaracinobacteroides saxicola]QMW22819.1 phosphoadenylyl-sulfate reductase [Sandaracinobacteroides saxicola]
MAEAARRIDEWSGADAPALNAHYGALTAKELLALVLRSGAFGRVALVSSFGAESAVLLHMVAAIDRQLPVLFVETGKHFPETLIYAGRLMGHLGMTGLTLVKPDPQALRVKDETGLRWSYDPDGCCDLRKTQPLQRAIPGFTTWLSGRKRGQAATRADMPLFENDEGRIKLNPLARWTGERLALYAREHGLPPHPLVAEGYPSIGCAPCTSKVAPGEDPRAGRWRGWDKVECGIHELPAF